MALRSFCVNDEFTVDQKDVVEILKAYLKSR